MPTNQLMMFHQAPEPLPLADTRGHPGGPIPANPTLQCGFPSQKSNHNDRSLSQLSDQPSSVGGGHQLQDIAPPPAAFQDNNFYLTETQPDTNLVTHSSSGTIYDDQ